MSNPLDNFIKSANSNLEQGKLFHEGKNGFQQISKIVVPKIKEGNRASGIDRGINSSNTEVNNAVEVFNRKVSEYNSVSNETLLYSETFLLNTSTALFTSVLLELIPRSIPDARLPSLIFGTTILEIC